MVTLPASIVSATWLAEHLGAANLVVCDVRWYLDGRSGEAAYDAGHIPGAVWVDIDTDLAGSPDAGPGRHPLPQPEVFAAAMAAKGIGDDTAVVAYDDAGGSIAARLWWMLRAIGNQAAVLDGGVSSWTGELSIDAPSRPADATFTPRAWPTDAVVDVIGIDATRRSPDAAVLDARSFERYSGQPHPADVRSGHVPGARNAPWTQNLDPATGRFRSPAELRERFTGLGVRPERDTVCYCGSGVTACHNLLALDLARIPGARLYPGSWSDWAADPNRPVATGA